jgi:hypothetical protein
MHVVPDPKPTARSFYAELAKQGFTADQVVDIAARLLDHVKDELAARESDRRGPALAAK